MFILGIKRKKKFFFEYLFSFFLELSGGNYLFFFFTLQIANGFQPGLSPTLCALQSSPCL